MPTPPALDDGRQQSTESREDYIKRQPVPDQGSRPWIGLKDYPLDSWAADEEGEVGYELSVSETGEIASCEIIYSSGFERLDNQTCELVSARAKLTPGVDPQGTRVAGTYTGFMVWSKNEPELKESYALAVRFELDEDGNQTNCEVLETTGELPERVRKSFEREPCPRNTAGEVGVPYRDENGAPIGKTITVRLEVNVEDMPE